jgi:hypothetical protein
MDQWEKGLSSICLVISVLAASLTLLVDYVIMSLIMFTDFEKSSTLLVFWCLHTVFMSISIISACCASACNMGEDKRFVALCIAIPPCILPYIWTTLILFSGPSPVSIFSLKFNWWIWSIIGGIATAIGAYYMCCCMCVPAVLGVIADCYVSSQAQDEQDRHPNNEQATLISPTNEENLLDHDDTPV